MVDDQFQNEVMIDIETERIIFYRVVIVIEMISILILIRQFAIIVLLE